MLDRQIKNKCKTFGEIYGEVVNMDNSLTNVWTETICKKFEKITISIKSDFYQMIKNKTYKIKSKKCVKSKQVKDHIIVLHVEIQ